MFISHFPTIGNQGNSDVFSGACSYKQPRLPDVAGE